MTTLSTRRTPSTPDGRLYDDDTHTCMALELPGSRKIAAHGGPFDGALASACAPNRAGTAEENGVPNAFFLLALCAEGAGRELPAQNAAQRTQKTQA